MSTALRSYQAIAALSNGAGRTPPPPGAHAIRIAMEWRRGIVLAAAMLAAGCASTRVTTAWRAPDRTPKTFTKVLALVTGEDQALRRVGETEICRRVAPTGCMSSFALFPSATPPDAAQARAKVRADGFDGAVVFRVVGQRQQTTVTPPTYAPSSFWGFYGGASPVRPNPAHVRTDTLVQVETRVYDLTADQLIWVGTTQTVNPSDVPSLVDGVATAVAADMREHGLLAPRD